MINQRKPGRVFVGVVGAAGVVAALHSKPKCIIALGHVQCMRDVIHREDTPTRGGGGFKEQQGSTYSTRSSTRSVPRFWGAGHDERQDERQDDMLLDIFGLTLGPQDGRAVQNRQIMTALGWPRLKEARLA